MAVALVLAILALVGERFPGPSPMVWATTSGIAGFISLTCFYRALSIGAMGLVAAVSGVIGAGIPVVVGFLTGDRLDPTDVIGIVLALVAVALVTRPADDVGIGREGLGLALVAGTMAGIFFIAMGRSAPMAARPGGRSGEPRDDPRAGGPGDDRPAALAIDRPAAPRR